MEGNNICGGDDYFNIHFDFNYDYDYIDNDDNYEYVHYNHDYIYYYYDYIYYDYDNQYIYYDYDNQYVNDDYYLRRIMEKCNLCGKKMPRHILALHMAKSHPATSPSSSTSLPEAKSEPVVDKVQGQSTVESVSLAYDKVIIFYPKFFLSPDREAELIRKGMPVEKKTTPNIVRDMFKKMWWSIKRNEMKIFNKDVGEYLLSKFGFLIRVQPHEIDKYRKIQADKEYKCHVCGVGVFETDTLIAYQQHMKTHNLSPEAQAMIASMEAAKPDGEVYSTQDAIQGKPKVDEYDGAPVGGTYDRPMVDSDGVEWVGPGSVKTQGMKLRPKFGAAGVFRGGV